MPPRSAEPAVQGQAPCLSDEEVVARILSGEVALFEMIMRRYNQRLFRTLRAMVPNDSEAEDVLQETYVQAYHHLAQFEGRAKFSTWLTRIAIHEALARQKRRRRFTSLDVPERQTSMADQLKANDPTPEEGATSTELRGVLQRAIDRMPDSLRVVFMMREVEGLDTEETAACLGLSAANVKVRLHQRLLEEINLSAIEKLPAESFREQTGAMITNLLKSERVQLNQREQAQITNDVIDEMVGLGPLEPLLKDTTVNDILVNTHRQVFVERRGRLELTPVIFQDEKHLLRIISKIVSAVGRRVDESQPMVDARLPDGSRVNVAIAPVAIDGPLVSIRKFAARPYTLDLLVENGSITPEVMMMLQGIVQARLNVLISGGTGSGKTTMLNALSRYIDGHERIITIEDAAELQLQQIHVARMETRPPNVEGRGEIRQRELVKNALRMRPDRIIVGEVRGGEAFDMLQAMNTGHDGSMTTVHANTPRDALSRLEQMIGMAALDLSNRSMRQQIASALHVVLQLQRLSDGRRKLVSLTEVTGMEGDVVQLQEIFRFVRRKTDSDGTVHGEFRATGIRPKFMSELQSRGIEMPPKAFDPERVLG